MEDQGVEKKYETSGTTPKCIFTQGDSPKYAVMSFHHL